ncbi:SDR family oxidoreductase [Amnibacterium setariae]|uniref:NAD-dependent epimerase/dehydratase family protein n=1 Tax=Amnibacterium setariae TaxID=2306585 RepID=A0A3A1U0P9_9MICO|nr:NAD(P)H-binding protein [Amnibacterium setariae]RIX29943.1 NAD-dependent epimerase/dehydratase family protein [Amnibacterium setariae]
MIVVIGATGNIGRPLVDLLAQDEEDVVAVSRNEVDYSRLPNVRWVGADMNVADSVRPLAAGARAVFVLLPGGLTSEGEDPDRLIRAVTDTGPERVVLVSSQIVGTRPAARSHARLAQYELALRTAGPGFTILRPNGFMSNALGWVSSIRAQRTVYAPFGDVALPSVDPTDVAAVAAAVLTQDGHRGRTYVLTGPAPITPREQARTIADALGEEVEFREVARDDAYGAMTRFMSGEMAAGSLDVLGAPVPEERLVSSAVASVLQRPPRTFQHWVSRNLQAFQ